MKQVLTNTHNLKKFTISDSDARKALTKHKGLLVMWANKNRHKLWDYSEVYSIGLEGLMKAVDRFSTERGSGVANYVTTVMDTGLWDALDIHTKTLKGRRELFKSEMPQVSSDAALQAKLDLNRILKHVTKHQRNVLVLRQIYGYTLKETAKVLQITHQAVDDLENRALNKLKGMYAKKDIY